MSSEAHAAPVTSTRVATPQDLTALVGRPLGVSSWRAVDQDAVNQFGAITGDEQWIHVDPDRAKEGPFGAPIAHGLFTLALATAFVYEVLDVSSASLIVNYGFNKVRFPAPVPSGSRIRAAIDLVAADEVSGGVQATMRLTFEVEGQDKPTCVAELLFRYLD